MRFRADIEGAAAAHGLDPDVVEAVVMQESGGRWWAYRYEPAFFTRYLATNPLYRDRDPREVSASYGLMQVMFTTAIENGFRGDPWKLFDPAVSLDLGCRHLARLIGRLRGRWTGPVLTGESIVLRSALASYNGGLTGNDPDAVPDRNRAYAEEVLARVATIRARRNA